MFNGAIYARDSTDKQGDTVEHQVQIIKHYCTRLDFGVEIDDDFIFIDNAASAYKKTIFQRSAMRSLMEQVDMGMIDVIFFKGITRFCRNSEESIRVARRLKQMGVRVISLEENYDSNKNDPTFFQMYAVMAEAESRKTSIRVSMGNKQLAKNGILNTPVIPLGYSRVKDLKDETLKKKLLDSGVNKMSLYPNEHAWIVKQVFDMYLAGKGCQIICGWLNGNGFRTIRGNRYYVSFVSRMLKNKIYIGTVEYGKHRVEYIESDDLKTKKIRKIYIEEKDWAVAENAHPSIIDKEVFMKVQKLSNEKRAKHVKEISGNSKHPLTGLIRCAKCGKNMICQKRTKKLSGSTKKEYRYYVCSTAHSQGRASCDQKNVNADSVEDIIYKRISSLIKTSEFDHDFWEKLKIKNPQRNIGKEIKLIESEIEKQLRKSLELLEIKDIYDSQTFRLLNLKIKDEISELKKTKRELESKMTDNEDTLTYDKLNKMIDDFDELNINDHAKLRSEFYKWINYVEVSGTDLELKLKINFPTVI